MDNTHLPNGKIYKSSDQFANLLVKTFGKVASSRKIQIISERINTLKNIYVEKDDKTHQAFGVIYFKSRYMNIDQKIEGKLISKTDLRLDEVNLNGERVRPVSYELPLHPISQQLIQVLDIVKEGLIDVDTINKILNYETVILTCSDPERCQATLQVVVGSGRNVKLGLGKIWIEDTECLEMQWMWPKPYITFTVSHAHFQSFFAGPHKFNWTHVEPRARYTYTFVQAEKLQPQVIRERFQAADYTFSDIPLQRDAYRGHILRFAVRDLQTADSQVTEIMESFEKNGYINYFNLKDSDLGLKSLIIIGKSLVTERLAKTVEWLLRPFAQTRDFSLEGLKALYFVFCNPKVLKTISRTSVSYLQPIFEGMPRNGRLCYIEARKILRNPTMVCLSEFTDLFLNFIWNETVNLMIRRRGLKLAKGDLVFCTPADEQRVLYEMKYDATVDKRKLDANMKLKEAVRPLTKEDIESNRFTIFDLVIPVCGSEVTWPKSDVDGIIDEVLRSHGIKDKNFFQKPSGARLPFVYRGTYRKVVCKPEHLKWWIGDYENDDEPLVLDDLEVEKKKHQEDLFEGVQEDGEIIEIKKALVVEFFVPKTTQLMTPLRELFKKNDFGELNAAYGETFGAKSEQIKKLMNSLDEYRMILLMNAPRERRQSSKRRPTRDVRPKYSIIENTLKRIENLEREWATIRTEPVTAHVNDLRKRDVEEHTAKTSQNIKNSTVPLLANNSGLIEPFFHTLPASTAYVHETLETQQIYYTKKNDESESHQVHPYPSDFYFAEEPQPKKLRLNFDPQPDDDFYDPFENSKEPAKKIQVELPGPSNEPRIKLRSRSSSSESSINDVGFSSTPSTPNSSDCGETMDIL